MLQYWASTTNRNIRRIKIEALTYDPATYTLMLNANARDTSQMELPMEKVVPLQSAVEGISDFEWHEREVRVVKAYGISITDAKDVQCFRRFIALEMKIDFDGVIISADQVDSMYTSVQFYIGKSYSVIKGSRICIPAYVRPDFDEKIERLTQACLEIGFIVTSYL